MFGSFGFGQIYFGGAFADLNFFITQAIEKPGLLFMHQNIPLVKMVEPSFWLAGDPYDTSDTYDSASSYDDGSQVSGNTGLEMEVRHAKINVSSGSLSNKPIAVIGRAAPSATIES